MSYQNLVVVIILGKTWSLVVLIVTQGREVRHLKKLVLNLGFVLIDLQCFLNLLRVVLHIFGKNSNTIYLVFQINFLSLYKK